MARGVNKVILLGNVGKDPEIRSTAGGTIVASFSLATADRQKDQQGKWQQRTPAMAAGLADHVWSLREWLTYPAKPCLPV